MKHWEKDLPAGYREAMTIDAKSDKKLIVKMTLASLAPFVVFNIVGVVLLAAFPGAWARFFTLIFLGLHIGGCAGDLYNTWLYLTRFQDPRTLTNDTGPVQTFYVPERDM